MNTKLTLDLEEDIIEKVESYAQLQGSNISNLIENYLKSIISDNAKIKVSSHSKLKSMRGAFNPHFGFDYKEELNKSLTEKYL